MLQRREGETHDSKAASSSTENTYVLLFCLTHETVLGFLLLLIYFLGNRMTQKAYEIMIYNQGEKGGMEGGNT